MTRVLVLNTGSSSVKWTVLAADRRVLAGGSEPWAAEDSGARAARLRAAASGGHRTLAALLAAWVGMILLFREG